MNLHTAIDRALDALGKSRHLGDHEAFSILRRFQEKLEAEPDEPVGKEPEPKTDAGYAYRTLRLSMEHGDGKTFATTHTVGKTDPYPNLPLVTLRIIGDRVTLPLYVLRGMLAVLENVG